MSVRFAPAFIPARFTGWQAGWRGLVCRARAQAANDNPGAPGESQPFARAFDPILTEALRHFAVHGLGAVDAALDEAAVAGASGDGNAKDHWLAITQIFDRRRAAAASAQSSLT
jgi:hypothetical protein